MPTFYDRFIECAERWPGNVAVEVQKADGLESHTYAELRRMALAALAEEKLHAGLTTETLLEAILRNAQAAERGEGAEDAMALPLSDADRQRLAKIVMREDDPLTADLLAGALEALRHRRQISQREVDIKRWIVEAERKNDVARLLQLKQEKLELDRKLAGF